MKKKFITTFEDAVSYLYDAPRFTTKSTMEETKAFLHRLGDPDKKMRIIHVAGTNGKGSVCAYLRSILEAAGYKVALFTSPHLVDIRERFVVEGEMISREDFLRAFLHIYNMLDWEALESLAESEKTGGKVYHPTYFEYLFFIAISLFAEKNPDFCILETGLGGRLDATNSVSRKELSVITHISLDHMDVLGHTIEKIAFEKAGIMYAGTPVVYWDTCPEVSAVFHGMAEKLGISEHSVSENDYTFSNFKRKTIDFCVSTGYYKCISLILHTIAAYQMENCALAIRAIEVLDRGKTITAEHIKKGVSDCFWAGRVEEVLPDVYVDGAHNEDGIRAFLETAASDGYAGKRNLLFSVVRDKDYEHMVERLVSSGLFNSITLARMNNKRAVEMERLKRLFEKYPDCVFRVYDNVEAAFRTLLQEQKEGERIYAVGSLYLVGEIKELLSHDKF